MHYFSRLIKIFNTYSTKENMRQRCWVELLNDYDCEIKYHPGRGNVVADALRRKERVRTLRVQALEKMIHKRSRKSIFKQKHFEA